MLHTKCQAAEPSGSEVEDFIFLSVHFYGSSLAPPPGPVPFWTLGPSFEQTWKRTTR